MVEKKYKVIHDETLKSFDVVLADADENYYEGFISFFYDFSFFGKSATKEEARRAAEKEVVRLNKELYH